MLQTMHQRNGKSQACDVVCVFDELSGSSNGRAMRMASGRGVMPEQLMLQPIRMVWEHRSVLLAGKQLPE
ncbi:hypothetical protein GQ457_06G019330 [Hibiscus cannabinus]